ncbi:MAG TPA: CapA family protein, partial [Thermoanaerobaculia bacterium]|nr:CapA family protein [Thermoanaerobaculia bacterium]
MGQPERDAVSEAAVERRELSLLLAGDALITRPWSHVRDAPFLELVETIRAADVAITNLETLLHEFAGHAQADCGGISMASPPSVAEELAWAGFDMVAHANNHTFDYGSEAVLETIGHVERAGLVLAGSGRDLQEARAPRYFRSGGGTVGLVAMAADFIAYGQASRSRVDAPGRPGLNPLTLVTAPTVSLPARGDERLRAFLRRLGLHRRTAAGPGFRVAGVRFRAGSRYRVAAGRRVEPEDVEGNLAAIAQAARHADVVVASVHAHRQRWGWLRRFADRAIRYGADVVFVHGPHEIRGIELRDGKPVFYCLGDFVFEIEHITRFPSEEYERLGLGEGATLEDLRAARASADPAGLTRLRKTFEGVIALLSIAEGRITRIDLLPLDLQFDAPGERRGRPQIAAA